MNESPTISDQTAAAANAAAPAPAAARAEESYAELLQRPLSMVVIGFLLLFVALAWSTHNRITHLRQDVARSLQKGEASSNETVALAHQVQEQT